MKLERWALIAEIVGGVAIVLSLIFVGLQVRQSAEQTALNTDAIRADAIQSLVDQISLQHTLMLENPQLAELRTRIFRGGDFNSDMERDQLDNFFRLSFRHGELAYRMYELGIIDEADLISLGSYPRVFSQTSFGRPIWEVYSRILTPGYVEFVNAGGPGDCPPQLAICEYE